MIWANYFNGFNKEDHSFPLIYKDQCFETVHDLLGYIEREFGNDPSQGLYYSTLSVCPINLFHDPKIQYWIDKFFVCRELGVKAFDCAYDDQPAYWIDFCMIMLQELKECEKERIRKDG